MAILLGLGIILSAVYSIWLYNKIFFGTLKTQYNIFYYDLTKQELYIYGILFIWMILIGLNSNIILNISLINIEYLLNYTQKF
jgi:NADH:ubiquinone oxidoreductase subunit 4 (subunit M)